MIAEITKLNSEKTPARSDRIKEQLKALAPWVTIEKLMAEKRATYDPALKAILRKHNRCPADIDARLDQACTEAIRENRPPLHTTLPAGVVLASWVRQAWESY